MEKILTCFCFTDIHNQQVMLDYPTTVRKSLIQANELATPQTSFTVLWYSMKLWEPEWVSVTLSGIPLQNKEVRQCQR